MSGAFLPIKCKHHILRSVSREPSRTLLITIFMIHWMVGTGFIGSSLFFCQHTQRKCALFSRVSSTTLVHQQTPASSAASSPQAVTWMSLPSEAIPNLGSRSGLGAFPWVPQHGAPSSMESLASCIVAAY